VRERLGLKPESSNTSRIDPRQLGYTWVPSGILTSAKIQRYFESLPPEKVPKLGTSGDKWRDKQLAFQLPKQDLAMTYCKNIEDENRASFEDFVSMRNEMALDIGLLDGPGGKRLDFYDFFIPGYVKDSPFSVKCSGCDDQLRQNEMSVAAPKLGEKVCNITIKLNLRNKSKFHPNF
jgi:prickle